jgi:hypothetical protein
MFHINTKLKRGFYLIQTGFGVGDEFEERREFFTGILAAMSAICEAFLLTAFSYLADQTVAYDTGTVRGAAIAVNVFGLEVDAILL